MNLQHTFFFTFLFRCCCNVKLPHYTFYGKNCCICSQKNFVACIPSCFFFQCCSFFTLLAASISYFLTAATKCKCCPSYEIRLLCFFFIACSSFKSPFFLLSFASLSRSFSFSLSFSFSIFRIRGYDN